VHRRPPICRRAEPRCALAAFVAIAGVAAGCGGSAPSAAPDASYQRLIAANYKTLTRRQSQRLLDYAEAMHTCLRKRIAIGSPQASPTRIAMALGDPVPAPAAVARLGVRCAARVGEPPAGSSLQVRGNEVLIYLPRRCILDRKVAAGAAAGGSGQDAAPQ
jgi:hypothetical protein